MPICYEIIPAQQVINTWAEGIVTDQDLSDYAKRVALDPLNQANYHELMDFTLAEEMRFSLSGIDEAARTVVENDRFEKASKLAIVVPQQDMVVFGELYRSIRFGSRRRIDIFSNLEDAKNWVGWSD